MVIKRLSHKKILLKYKVPFYIGEELSQNITVKFRYLDVGLEDTYYDFKMIGNFDRFISIISQKLKLKKKLFIYDWEKYVNIELESDKYKIDSLLVGIHIDDTATIREYKLNKILI